MEWENPDVQQAEDQVERTVCTLKHANPEPATSSYHQNAAYFLAGEHEAASLGRATMTMPEPRPYYTISGRNPRPKMPFPQPKICGQTTQSKVPFPEPQLYAPFCWILMVCFVAIFSVWLLLIFSRTSSGSSLATSIIHNVSLVFVSLVLLFYFIASICRLLVLLLIWGLALDSGRKQPPDMSYSHRCMCIWWEKQSYAVQINEGSSKWANLSLQGFACSGRRFPRSFLYTSAQRRATVRW